MRFASTCRRGAIGVVIVCLAAGCAEIGPPSGRDFGSADAGTSNSPDAARSIDASSPPDAAPPDAQACVEGDAQVVGPDGTCYVLFLGPSPWTTGRQACQQLGGDLARIDSSAENDLLFELAAGQIDVWVGGNDRVTEGRFVWLDDTQEIVPPLFSQWRSGEPNDSGGEDCMIIEADNPAREWDDRNCENQSYPFICER